MLDVGTDRGRCSKTPCTSATGTPAFAGQRYDEFIDAYVEAATKLFPRRCCTGRTSAPCNARRILEQYRDHIRTFNDDMQGTGAIALAAISRFAWPGPGAPTSGS